MNIKYGVVGFSQGNGHPYSWSIACNGYSKKNLNLIPFEQIKNYLQKYDFEHYKIPGVEVSHIWTQNIKNSKKIAHVCNIKNVCKSLKQLINSVDAILFLRDDVLSREKYLPLVLKSGKPVFVDKFIHLNKKDTKKLLNMQKFKGQIFSESSFSNCKKLILNDKELSDLGELKLIIGISPSLWNTYAIHLIDSTFKFFSNKKILDFSSLNSKDITSMNIRWSNNLITNYTTVKDSNIKVQLDLIGEYSQKKITWDIDTVFDNFISSIKKFTYMINNKKFNTNKQKYIFIADILEKGLKKN